MHKIQTQELLDSKKFEKDMYYAFLIIYLFTQFLLDLENLNYKSSLMRYLCLLPSLMAATSIIHKGSQSFACPLLRK